MSCHALGALWLIYLLPPTTSQADYFYFLGIYLYTLHLGTNKNMFPSFLATPQLVQGEIREEGTETIMDQVY